MVEFCNNNGRVLIVFGGFEMLKVAGFANGGWLELGCAQKLLIGNFPLLRDKSGKWSTGHFLRSPSREWKQVDTSDYMPVI